MALLLRPGKSRSKKSKPEEITASADNSGTTPSSSPKSRKKKTGAASADQSANADGSVASARKSRNEKSKPEEITAPAASPFSNPGSMLHAASSNTGTSKQANSVQSSTPSSPEITAAQASGKVWVNLESGIYHKGGRWYGKTKHGKFMSEAEATGAGYRESQN